VGALSTLVLIIVWRQSPVKRPPRHVERVRDCVVVFPLFDKLAGMGDLLRGELWLAAHLHPTGDRRRASRRGAFLNQRPFKFRQYPGSEVQLTENVR